MEQQVFDRYLRQEKLPQMWCPGCGNGIVLQAIVRAVDRSGIDPDSVVVADGIGCSSRANNYLKLCGMHTNHGRAIAYATGAKLFNPALHLIVITGDGDCVSIGGNHFIQAARRNIDLTVVVFNNSNYGMTGGQYSPTTPTGAVTKTSVWGNIEQPFDICRLAAAAGATYVARSTAYHAVQLSGFIEKGLLHKGFSVIEAACDCPTLFGRLNGRGTPAEMLLRWKDICVSAEKAKGMTPEELAGRLVTGEFVCDDMREEYTARYDRLIALAREDVK